MEGHVYACGIELSLPLFPRGLDLQGKACSQKDVPTYLVSQMLLPLIKLWDEITCMGKIETDALGLTKAKAIERDTLE